MGTSEQSPEFDAEFEPQGAVLRETDPFSETNPFPPGHKAGADPSRAAECGTIDWMPAYCGSVNQTRNAQVGVVYWGSLTISYHDSYGHGSWGTAENRDGRVGYRVPQWVSTTTRSVNGEPAQTDTWIDGEAWVDASESTSGGASNAFNVLRIQGK